MMAAPRVVDIHTHTHSDTAAMCDSARRNRIDRVCISSLGRPYTQDPDEAKVRACNDEVLDLLRRYPDLLVGFCYLSPRHSSAFNSEELDRCVGGGMRGVKLWVFCPAADERVEPIAADAARRGLPLLQHSFANVQGNKPGESDPKSVCELARKFPELQIIMAHLTGNGYRGVLDIAPYPNIHLDTSGGYPAAAVSRYALETLGAERLLFGSDAPGRNFAVQLARAKAMCRTPREEELVLGANAGRLLGL